MLSAPSILEPFSGLDFSTNKPQQRISGVAPAGTNSVFVNGSNTNVVYNPLSREYYYDLTLISTGPITFVVQAFDTELGQPASITINYQPADTVGSVQSPPSGIYLRSYFNAIEVVIEEPLAQGVDYRPLGYNIYYSEVQGVGYQRLNATPIQNPTEIARNILERNTERLPDTTLGQVNVLVGDFQQVSNLDTIIYQKVGRYIYRHTPEDTTVPLNTAVPAFYFITSVYFDTVNRVEIESSPSLELVTSALVIDQSIVNLPLRTRDDVSADYINFVFDTDRRIDLAPGSITQDIYIQPFGNEAEKLYFLADFNSRSQSFQTLVQLDDADGDGISDPVSTSIYKQRLKLAYNLDNNFDVQAIIDSRFTQLGSNYRTFRLESSASIGTALFRTKNLTSDRIVNAGAVVSTDGDLATGEDPVFFNVEIGGTMLVANAANYYNPDTGYFELRLPATCQTPGSIGNISEGQIKNIVSGVVGSLEVINDNPFEFGEDLENNISLAQRASLSLVGVDTGTEGGYLYNTLKIPGVVTARVIDSGNPLMVRDIVELSDGRLKHVNGTVDLYVQGALGINTRTETFGFSDLSRDQERVMVVNTTFYQLAVTNPDVGSENPISNVTSVYNFTRQQPYDLTNIQILGGNVIDLDETLNSGIGICDEDIIRVTYTYRKRGVFEFSSQPVEAVTSIVGDISGDLKNNFNLIRGSHPLLEGLSNNAGDYLELFFDNGKPSGLNQSFSESFDLLEEFPAPLSKFGITIGSIVVRDANNNIYQKDTDYTVLLPTELDSRTRIRRVEGGAIPNTSTVFVSYTHAENITVTYTYYTLPSFVYNKLVNDRVRNICANLLVKTTLRTPVDIDMVVVRRNNTDASSLDFLLRFNIQSFFNRLISGESVHPSDIIALVDNTVGVDLVIDPLTRLSRADNSYVVDEQLGDVLWVPYANDLYRSYITEDPCLVFNTEDTGGLYQTLFGGPGYEKRIVSLREGFRIYPQQDVRSDVARGLGRTYIQGDGRIIVSTWDNADPNGRQFYASYYVKGETGSKSIIASDNERLTLGRLNIRIISRQG